MTQVTVQLGEHEVPVFAQRHAYLEKRLGKWFGTFVASANGLSPADLAQFVGGSAYEVLSVMIPALPKRMPKWEFDGYGSAEAATEDDYDETLDKSPTLPEIVAAFEAAISVNRFDIFKVMGKLVDPQLLRAILNERLAASISKQSLNSPPVNGESDQMSSGMTDPISTATTV